MYKDKEKLKFHVSTDNSDDWMRTKQEARDAIKRWRAVGHKSFRIYTCKWNVVEGVYDDVDCIYTTGNFPM